MSPSATPASPTPAGDDRNLVAVDATTAVTFEDKLQLFWKKNRGAVLGACVAVVVLLLGKGAWDYMARQKEQGIEREYAAATTPEQVKAFAAAHPNHSLGGIAQLRVADEAFTAGKWTDAIAAYDKAIAILKDNPLAARAKLGRAVAKAQSGKAAEAQTELKQLADDTKQLKALRAEAAYHLTGLAVDAGNATDAQKYVDQLNQIQPMGELAQRAIMLRSTLPASATPPAAPAPAAPAVEAKKDEPSVQVKLPGK